MPELISLSASSTAVAAPAATPALAAARAAALTPRLFAQAAHSDLEGGFPTQEFNWLRETGLLVAPLPAALGGSSLNEPAHTYELLSTLRNTLNYFVNTHPSLHFDEIVLSGGGTRLPGFREALAEITRVPVASADPFNSIDISHDLTKQGEAHANSMAVALGLALGRVA